MNYWMFLVVICLMLGPLFWYPRKSFLIMGHRGASGYEPENTLSSFKKALAIGVDGVEVDVHVCATGELVAMHDDEVDRTTNGHGNVADMSLDQLRQLHIEGNEKIPTLSEVIDLVDRKVVINIELKGMGVAKPVSELLQDYVKRGWLASDFVVSSFNPAELKLFHESCPQIKTGLLIESLDKLQNVFEVAREVKAKFVGVLASLITKELVQDAHRQGFLIFAWTVNEKQISDHMRDMKVDGVFSDYPDKVV